ncbi:hypothetical protein FQR65_LT04454 [Abscondita terminalis]|nr:hypothetical protein FQR65_LT04454 [Abscondita terminalis]
MKVAIVGAGVSGLLSLKYGIQSAMECECFEETGTFGGTWVYTSKTNTDENGFPIYNSMYDNFLTTLPKELMTFADFPYQQNLNYSHLRSSDVFQYLSDYVRHFNLEKHISYYTLVTKVELTDDDKWVVTFKNLLTKTTNSRLYDYVFVCNGHYRFPRVPVIPGQNLYQGIQIHSRDYRNSKMCQNKRVLIIGASISGVDIANQVVGIANLVFLSQRVLTKSLIDNVVNKPLVIHFETNCVFFADGSKEEIDVVVYCTGYEYKFPFLDHNCGITVTDSWVRPLYKHVVNIKHPTMVFIGLPSSSTAFLVDEFQVQFAIGFIKGEFNLPSRQEMENDLKNYVARVQSKSGGAKCVHRLFLSQTEYLSDLAKIASLKPLSQNIIDLFEYTFLKINESLVIGAGVSGLLSLKYVLENGIDCDCFEETDSFGGTWVYTPETGTDRNGLPIYRSITNIPKELMTFTNFPYPKHINYSYIRSEEVLNYISDYVKQFDLEKHILYHTVVTKVEPTENDTWVVTTKNLVTQLSISKLYNYVFVCSGHFRSPYIPVIPDQDLY